MAQGLSLIFDKSTRELLNLDAVALLEFGAESRVWAALIAVGV